MPIRFWLITCVRRSLQANEPLLFTIVAQLLRELSQTEWDWSSFFTGVGMVLIPSVMLLWQLRYPVGSPRLSKPERRTRERCTHGREEISNRRVSIQRRHAYG